MEYRIIFVHVLLTQVGAEGKELLSPFSENLPINQHAFPFESNPQALLNSPGRLKILINILIH